MTWIQIYLPWVYARLLKQFGLRTLRFFTEKDLLTNHGTGAILYPRSGHGDSISPIRLYFGWGLDGDIVELVSLGVVRDFLFWLCVDTDTVTEVGCGALSFSLQLLGRDGMEAQGPMVFTEITLCCIQHTC